MKNLTFRVLVIQSLLMLTMHTAVNAQTTATEKKTDTVARLAVHYMNDNQPDSVYQLAGEYFRSQIPATTWTTIYTNQLSALLPFTKVEFISGANGVNTYKLTGKVTLTYNVGLDSKNKLATFSFVPYKE